MELLIQLVEALVQRWLFAETAVEVDLAALARDALARARLSCTAPADGVYLARLQPLPASARALLHQVQPASAGTWHSRLTTGAHRADERAIVAALERHLEESPLAFAIG